jgi:hypothetical protein
MGGVETEGISKEGELRSIAPAECEFGEGIAEPVEAYKGRNSSALWAKKQTFLAQPVSSLQSLVLYWAGWSHDSKTPWAYSQESPFAQLPLRNSGHGTQV